MAKIELTPAQRAVVENRGGSLLVSAAAGSGKTKVLVDRLFSYVMGEGCNLDDFLIITYTRAAAAELRSKIASELAKRLAEAADDPHLPFGFFSDCGQGLRDSRRIADDDEMPVPLMVVAGGLQPCRKNAFQRFCRNGLVRKEVADRVAFFDCLIDVHIILLSSLQFSYLPSILTASFIFSRTGTANGQRFSHAPH